MAVKGLFEYVLLVWALRVAGWVNVGATIESPAFSTAGYWGEGIGLNVIDIMCARPW